MDLNQTFQLDGRWAVIENVWFKLLKSVGVSGWAAVAYSAYSQHAALGLVTKELTHARSGAWRSTHSIAIMAVLNSLVCYI